MLHINTTHRQQSSRPRSQTMRIRARRTTVAATLAIVSAAAFAPLAGAQATQTAPATMSGHASADAAQLFVNFITSVNRDEAALGKLAVEKATNPAVKAYAQRMVEDHNNAQSAWAQKVPSLSLTIPDSASAVAKPPQAGSAAMAGGMSEVRDTTTGLRGGTAASAIHNANVAALAELKGLSGAQFDQAYVKAQVASHEAILKELAAQPEHSKDLQTLIVLFRTATEKHLSDAKALHP
jgi:predicted outer membrane protein